MDPNHHLCVEIIIKIKSQYKQLFRVYTETPHIYGWKKVNIITFDLPYGINGRMPGVFIETGARQKTLTCIDRVMFRNRIVCTRACPMETNF